MRPYILQETNYRSTKDWHFELAVLPWAATEAHNMHLPYGTDIIETEKIAAEAGRLAWEAGARIIILPVLPFGVNTGQKDILLDINMNPGTQLAVLNDVVEVLDHQKIHKLLILNGHGGNEFRPLIREASYRHPEMFISLCNWYQVLRVSDYFEISGEHAGEMETSLMLHLAPELVRPLSEAGPGKEKQHRLAAFREGWAWAERKWPMVTEDTGIGDPSGATAEKGRRYFTDLTKKISSLLVDLAGADKNNLYS
jgi:creatinine amidohydrolase